ncbi:MAG: NAD(P)-dependent alcohol dehydrogenase [Emcibacter sp.]|nr:NAD(P)-dependent alcohol dehydrogenase [Emcibacter sp.]
MLAFELPKFGIDNLHTIELDEQALKSGPVTGQVLIKFKAASINYRDFMIAEGLFAPQENLPIIPLSDGAGEVVAIGDGVTRVAVGDLVTPLFFPQWFSGDALGTERAVSTGLEAPGCLRKYGSFDEKSVVKVADHLDAEQAACFPCAGLTAWNALVTTSAIKAGDTILVLGTGGVAIFALQFAKALGATVIITSSSDDKLAQAKALGADHIINYITTPEWGEAAKTLTNGEGVNTVVEIGGTGTLAQSFKAIRRGGHIAIIGALAGAQMEILVYELIMTNAHLHGISVGNRDDFEAMMAFVSKHKITPVIEKNYPFESAATALGDIDRGKHFGKLTISI